MSTSSSTSSTSSEATWGYVYVTTSRGPQQARARFGPLANYKLDETGLTWKLHRASGEYRLTDLTEGRPLTPAPRSPLDEPLRWECVRLHKELSS